MFYNVVDFDLYYRALCGKKANKDDIKDKKQEEGSRLDAKFFSFLTFYYMVCLYKDILSNETNSFVINFYVTAMPLNVSNDLQFLINTRFL